MKYYNRILVGLDGSANGDAALAWALTEARARHCEIEAFWVWQVPALAYSAPGYLPPEPGVLETEGGRILAEALAGLGGPDDVKVSLRVTEGSPAMVLLHASEEPDVGMVVVGSRGHGPVSGLLLGSVSHSLTHECKRPLTIVPGGWEADGGRIVVGVDGSSGSRAALDWAVVEGGLRNVDVEAVMVWPSPPPELPAHVPTKVRNAAGIQPAVAEKLAAAVAEVGAPGVEVIQTVLYGHPARTLMQHAAEAGLLVVGTRGLGRAHEAVTGSVSHSCTHHATVPVTVVPEQGMTGGAR